MTWDRDLFEEALSNGLQAWSLDHCAAKVPEMARFAELVVHTNQQLNLTRIVEPVEMALKNFLDSLSILQLPWPTEMRCMDVGTGAGFPGVPLAMVQGGWEVVLLDSLRKRLDFLAGAAAELSLDNVSILHSRAEDAGRHKEHRQGYDLVVSRAVAALPVLLELCTPLVKEGGLFAAYKGAGAALEVESAATAMDILQVRLERVFPLELPGEMGERNILLFRKTAPTPRSYPRKAGVPAKRPLE